MNQIYRTLWHHRLRRTPGKRCWSCFINGAKKTLYLCRLIKTFHRHFNETSRNCVNINKNLFSFLVLKGLLKTQLFTLSTRAWRQMSVWSLLEDIFSTLVTQVVILWFLFSYHWIMNKNRNRSFKDSTAVHWAGIRWVWRVPAPFFIQADLRGKKTGSFYSNSPI